MNPKIKVSKLPPAPEPTKSQKVEVSIGTSKMLSRRSFGRNRRILKQQASDTSRDLPETRAKG